MTPMTSMTLFLIHIGIDKIVYKGEIVCFLSLLLQHIDYVFKKSFNKLSNIGDLPIKYLFNKRMER